MDKKTATQFIKILKELPEEIQFYFDIDLPAQSIKEINNAYNIKQGYLSDLTIEVIADNFNFNKLENIIKEDLNFEDEKIKLITLDFIGKIFLPVDKYLEKINIEDEITKRKGNIGKYKEYINNLVNKIEEEKDRLLDELLDKHEKLNNIEEESKVALDILQNNLFDVIKSGASESTNDLNSALINLLYNKNDFKKEAENLFYNNSEKITHKEFKLEEKPKSPSVKNWLQDFIKKEGTGMFTNVDISKYVINSPNAKNLDPEERELLVKLLVLYRNLKFFPESMEGVPVEDWAIIPTEKSEELLKAREVSGPPKTEEEKKIEEYQEAEERLAKSELERKVIDEAGVQAQRRIEDLKILAKKYKKGSLEAKAIEEEIGKLEGS